MSKDLPHYSFPEVTRELGTRWSGMTEEEKEPYLSAAKTAKEQFLIELSAWEARNQDERPVKRQCTLLMFVLTSLKLRGGSSRAARKRISLLRHLNCCFVGQSRLAYVSNAPYSCRSCRV